MTLACVTEEHVDEFPVILKVKLLKHKSKETVVKAWARSLSVRVSQSHTPAPLSHWYGFVFVSLKHRIPLSLPPFLYLFIYLFSQK